MTARLRQGHFGEYGESLNIRRLESHEVDLHREIRLRSLSEAAEFLGGTFAEAAARPMHHWEDWTRRVTAASLEREVLFLASAGSLIVGCGYGHLDTSCAGDARINGMWVEPIWRRCGIARALLHRLVGWAREASYHNVLVWVPALSEAAIALYLQAGFRRTGQISTLTTNSELRVVEMLLVLEGRKA